MQVGGTRGHVVSGVPQQQQEIVAESPFPVVRCLQMRSVSQGPARTLDQRVRRLLQIVRKLREVAVLGSCPKKAFESEAAEHLRSQS